MILIRPVQPEDLAAICVHRRRMFGEMGVDAATLDLMDVPFAEWLAPRLEDESYFGFVVEDEGAAVAGIGLRLIDWPPNPHHPVGDQRGAILNLFVDPEYRGRGIAQDLMRRSEEEFRARGMVFAVLNASAMGRPIHEKLGWVTTSEMWKAL